MMEVITPPPRHGENGWNLVNYSLDLKTGKAQYTYNRPVVGVPGRSFEAVRVTKTTDWISYAAEDGTEIEP